MSGKLISDLSKLTDEQLEQNIMIPGSKEGEPMISFTIKQLANLINPVGTIIQGIFPPPSRIFVV